jgi:DNA-binding MarR family transcriptional regulator
MSLPSRVDVKTFRPQDVRFFRLLGRRGRLHILAHLLRHPKDEFSLRDLSAASRVPLATASRAVRDLEALSLVRRRRLGRAHAISLWDESGAVAFVRRLLDLARYA